MMHPLAREIYEQRAVHNGAGKAIPLHSEVDPSEGEMLERLIRGDPGIRKTLEVGCAYGLSSLHICSGLSGRERPQHIIVDPFQHERYEGIGVLNLQRAGFDFFEIIEEPSEFLLPRLAQTEAGGYDFVFIDGWHTLDHTLVDVFYANRLVRVGGYIAIDDCTMPSVAQVVAYFSRFPAYRIMESARNRGGKAALRRVIRKALTTMLPPTVAGCVIPKRLYDKAYRPRLFSSMIVLQKVEEDLRPWNWYVSC